MANYGVNLVAQHNHWDNLFQQLRGKATFEVCAFGLCREQIIEFSAADLIEWSLKVVEWMNAAAKDLSIPIGNGGTQTDEAYTPAHTGEMVIEAILYVPDEGEPTPATYEYEPAPPMDEV